MNMNALLGAGYAYELAGICYYAFFILMTRKANVARFSQRSRVLTLLAAISMVGTIVGNYASTTIGISIMITLGIASLLSTFLDRFGK